ncbi:MAG TPA: efflux RND transporter periplasmic adaptor subunit [Cyclobacteriaceae bacterium]|nr:efflux RND transporter periplasmic adaptor subunit [Cyclobacteriaceae bacterium]
MKKQIITGSIIVVVVLLLAIPKLGWFSSKSDGGEAIGSPGGPPLLPVEALIVKPAKLDNRLIVTGTVLANESLELKSEISGKITHIAFQEGARVKKGSVLVQINDEEIRAQLLKQKYNQKLNEDNEFRQRKLLEKDAISQEEYDNALNRLNTTVADVQLLDAQLAKTRITAPFDGIIGLRYVSEGTYLSPNTAIATLYNNTPAKLEFAIPSRYSAAVATGKEVFFKVEGDTLRHNGKVYAIEPRIDQDTRTLKLRALADNSNGRLLPGQFVELELILGSVNNAMLIPTECMVPEQGGKKVFVLENGIVRETQIETGIRTNTDLEVTRGLKNGDTVLTTGILQLRAGMKVQITTLR